jgi:hypothetical protein
VVVRRGQAATTVSRTRAKRAAAIRARTKARKEAVRQQDPKLGDFDTCLSAALDDEIKDLLRPFRGNTPLDVADILGVPVERVVKVNKKPRGRPRKRKASTGAAKVCGRCRQMLPMWQFSRNRKEYYSSSCQLCAGERSRERHPRHWYLRASMIRRSNVKSY